MTTTSPTAAIAIEPCQGCGKVKPINQRCVCRAAPDLDALHRHKDAQRRQRDLNRLTEIMREIRAASAPWQETTLRLFDEAIGIHHRIEIEDAERRR